MLTADAKVTLQTEIAHSGAGTALDLFVDGQRVRRQSVDPGAPGKTQVALSFSPRRSGRLSGHVALADDALALDNRRYFTLDLPTAITVLLVGEQPEDAYYARRALGAAALSDPVVKIRTGLFANLDASTLAGVDVLVLCNLARLSAAQKAVLDEFVASGGGVVPLSRTAERPRLLQPRPLARPDSGALQKPDRHTRQHSQLSSLRFGRASPPAFQRPPRQRWRSTALLRPFHHDPRARPPALGPFQ